MNDRENRDAANTAAAFRRAAHLLTAFAAQRWNGEQIDVMERFGGLIRDICAHIAGTVAHGMGSDAPRFQRLMETLWNVMQDGAGLAKTQLFPPALDPKLVVLRHLFDAAHSIADPKPRSDKEWANAIGFWEKHMRDPLPADKPHTLCDPSADSATLWNLLHATGARVTSEIPELIVAWYRNRGAMPTAKGLCCAEVRFMTCVAGVEPHPNLDLAEDARDSEFYRADLSVALSLLLVQPHLFKNGHFYVFSGVSRPHQGEDWYPMVMGGPKPACSFGRPKHGEAYFSVRLEK